ncbi:hypothetical protein GE09DRAFT_68249 [Coniochaeta sp. 2T2.1]|nr:hypothetical protein GE09DRAFT_68249 [Coniochaeta sp. 2T2.1]
MRFGSWYRLTWLACLEISVCRSPQCASASHSREPNAMIRFRPKADADWVVPSGGTISARSSPRRSVVFEAVRHGTNTLVWHNRPSYLSAWQLKKR